MMNTNARNKLRSMGGIMASSPELMRAAQGYRDGGNITVPMVGAPMGLSPIGGPTGVYTPQRAAQLQSRIRAEAIRPDPPVQVPEFVADPGASTTANPTSAFDTLSPEAQQGLADRFAAEEVIETRPPVDLPSPELEPRPKPEAPSDTGIYSPGAVETRKQQQEQKPESAEAPAPEPRPLDDLQVPEELFERVQESLQDDPRLGGGGGDGGDGGDGGGGGGGGGKTTKKDLRSRYKEKIELFKEIYGEDDEARAQDRMLSLAMMGLAIASGQSPDALTNIAQGAAVGLQGMSEQERARREQERGLQTLALESAIAEQQGEAEAAARAAEQDAEFQNRLDVEEVRARGEKTSGLNRDDTPADVYNAAFSTLGRTMSAEEARQEALRQAQDHLVLISPRLTEEQLKAELAALQSLAASQTDPVQTWIATRREQNVSDEKIRELLKKQGHTPEDYGL